MGLAVPAVELPEVVVESSCRCCVWRAGIAAEGASEHCDMMQIAAFVVGAKGTLLYVRGDQEP
jgi:hypothetical protein